MRKLLLILGLCWTGLAAAQFTPGQILTAAELNSQFALYAPLAGAAFTGPVAIPTLTVSTTFSMPASTVLPSGVTATTNGRLDNSLQVATDAFVNQQGASAVATVPFANVTGGTYNQATLGSGCQVVVFASGGVITASLTISNPGSGYAVGDLLAVPAGNSDAVLRVTGVSGGGVTSVGIAYGGTGYTTGNVVTTMGVPPGRRAVVFTGTLTSNLTFIIQSGTYLTASREVEFINNTTGAFTITVKLSNGAGGSTGTGVVLPQGTNNSTALTVYTDGVNDVWLSNAGSVPTSVPLSSLAAQAANTVVANVTGSTARPTAFAMPSCSTSASALDWASGTGFTCNTSINASTLGGATFAAPGAIGGTTPGASNFTSSNVLGSLTGAVTTYGFLVNAQQNSTYTAETIMGTGGAGTDTNWDAVRGVADVTPGTTVTNVNGVAGYVIANQASSVAAKNGVALFGWADANVTGADVWGINTVVTDCIPNVACSGGTNGLSNEFDYNANNASDVVYGLVLTGASSVQPSYSAGLQMYPLDAPGNMYPWNVGVLLNNGSVQIGMQVGTTAPSGASLNSAPINMQYTDSGSVEHTQAIQATPNGLEILSSLGTSGQVLDVNGNALVYENVTSQTGNFIGPGTGFSLVTNSGFSSGGAIELFDATHNNEVSIMNGGSSVANFTSTGINSANIGATTPSTGAFTTLSAASATYTGAASLSYSNPVFTLNDTSGVNQANMLFQSNGSTIWGIAKISPGGGANQWQLQRYNSGSLVDAPISVSNSTGAVTMTDGIVGTTTNNNASAGSIGEFPTPSNLSGVSMTSGASANVSSISLTPGDWDVSGSCQFIPAGSTVVTNIACGVSTTSNTLGTIPDITYLTAAFGNGAGQFISTPTVRISIASTTTVYIVSQTVFGTSTMTSTGFLRARRVR